MLSWHAVQMETSTGIVKSILHLSLLTLLVSGQAQAGVYRCKDASGATTYSQTPCKAGEKSQTMNHVQRTTDPAMAQACKGAHQFSGIVFSRMQAGASPEEVMDEYGGVNYINAPTLNIINYVGTFRHQVDTPNHQVRKLASTKCMNGGFGRFAATDLPLTEDDLIMIGALPPRQPGVAQPSQGETGTPPAAAPTTPDAQTIQQLEQYLEQLKAQQQQP